MASLSVDPTTLRALQNTIAGLQTELDGMQKIAPSFQALIGGGGLEGAVGHFLDAWHTGVGLIGDDIDNVIKRLGQAAKGYDDTEACIAAASGG
ncbi:MAG: hypothetical protein M3071_03495 [Actinomycetota bacterium]|nr:hypothetical protein [Actinomycetota bacterium]